MAKTKKRTRRTPEQMVADLEAEIERVRKRAATKEAQQTPEGKAFFSAVRALDRASSAAPKGSRMREATEAARAVLGEAMIEMGVRLPVRKRR